MRVLGQDSRLSTALLELFLSSPGSLSSFRLRSRVYACAATGLPRGPRASLLRAQRYHNICTRGEPGIRACITCDGDSRATREYFALAPSQLFFRPRPSFSRRFDLLFFFCLSFPPLPFIPLFIHPCKARQSTLDLEEANRVPKFFARL